MSKPTKSADERLAEYPKAGGKRKEIRPSKRKPARLPDGKIGEQYAFIKFKMSYDPTYDIGRNNEQEKLENLLDEFVLAYTPKSYRIINAQIVYLGVGEGRINSMPAGILHVVHIGYQV